MPPIPWTPDKIFLSLRADEFGFAFLRCACLPVRPTKHDGTAAAHALEAHERVRVGVSRSRWWARDQTATLNIREKKDCTLLTAHCTSHVISTCHRYTAGRLLRRGGSVGWLLRLALTENSGRRGCSGPAEERRKALESLGGGGSSRECRSMQGKFPYNTTMAGPTSRISISLLQ
jgi:hypothetical protein